jgi:hypothetical protein
MILVAIASPGFGGSPPKVLLDTIDSKVRIAKGQASQRCLAKIAEKQVRSAMVSIPD